MPRPPAASTSAAVSSIVSGRFISDRCDRVVRPVQYTVAPAAPSCTAMPRPAPRVAPATNATFPLSDLPIAATLHDHAPAAAQRSERPPSENPGATITAAICATCVTAVGHD